MKKYKEKVCKKYVIADLSEKTNYLFSNRNGNYSLIDNIAVCTKFVSKAIAKDICDECITNCGMQLVVVPLLITYELIDEEGY